MQRLAVIAIVGMVTVGCGGGSKPLHVSADKERAWVSSAQDWLALEAFQGNFRGCDKRLAAKVGPSPARDLQPIERPIGVMCADFARAYRDLDASFKRNDADLYQRSQVEMHRAESQIKPVRSLVDAWRPGLSGGLPTKGGDVETSRIEPRLSAAANVVAQTPVTVRCWSVDDWPRIKSVALAEGATAAIATDLGGLADPTSDTIDLSPEGCRDLVHLTYAGVQRGASEAYGLTLLAHEATHLRGDSGSSEAVTECYAMQRDVDVAPKLGVSAADARRLARTYWNEIYPEDLPEYTTRDCRSNGPLDLNPNDPTWP